MLRAVLFDLFETLVTESSTRPAGVSSLAPAFGCERQAFRTRWKALRPAVTAGHMSFHQALEDITTALGCPAEEATLRHACDERSRIKAQAFAQIEHQVLMMLDDLRRRHLRLGVISNCLAEDVAAWPQCALVSRFDCTVFSFEVGLAKPDPDIYREAVRRLDVDVSETWYIGDGGDDELAGAEHAGLRAFQARWFLQRWPHFREDPGQAASFATTEDAIAELGRLAPIRTTP